MVDFMTQPDTTVVSMGAKTIPGVFIGCHVQPGGLWSGDYYVAYLAPFRLDCDVAWSKVKAHRIKEVVSHRLGKVICPVVQWRRTRVENQQFGIADVPEMPGLEPDIESDGDEGDLPRPAGSSTDGQAIPTDVEPAEALPPQGRVLSAQEIAPGTDTRGLGLETFEGRATSGIERGPPDLQRYRLSFGSLFQQRRKRRRSQNTRKNSMPPASLLPPSQTLCLMWLPFLPQGWEVWQNLTAFLDFC